MVAGTADNPVPPRVYVHPESPATGEAWMRNGLFYYKLIIIINFNLKRSKIIN
jgi:T-box protein 18